MAQQNKGGNCTSKTWGAIIYDKFWRARAPRITPEKELTCDQDPGILHFVSYYTRQKKCPHSLLRVLMVTHTPSHSPSVLGLVGRSAQSGTWSTMEGSNCWREVESVFPVCPGWSMGDLRLPASCGFARKSLWSQHSSGWRTEREGGWPSAPFSSLIP